MISTRSIPTAFAIYFLVGAFLPLTLFAEQGSDNPTGVSGIFNGNVTTAGSYDPYTGNAIREVDDIVVPGSIGAYPLKWTRYFNSHSTFQYTSTGGRWRFSYLDYSITSNGPIVYFPDGRALDFTHDLYGVPEFVDGSPPVLHLADGGRVIFAQTSPGRYAPSQVIDPYGKTTTIETTGSGSSATTKITEPGGRYLLVSYRSDGNVDQVQAFDGISGHAAMESVTYTWDPPFKMHDGSYVPVLNRVDYSDATHATYQYVDQPFLGPCVQSPFMRENWHVALLSSADDVRYTGPMRQISYTYAQAGSGADETHDNHTRIMSENYLATGQKVSSIAPGKVDHTTTTATETRGDGPSRTFTYHTVGYPDCPPVNQEGEPREPPPPMPLDGKLISFTDFQGHPTSITYSDGSTDGAPGYVTAVQDANLNITTYTRSQVSWAILRITHPPTASEPQGSHIDQTFTDEAHPYFLASRTDENLHTTVYHRDDPANPNAITRKDYADGTFETFTYTNFGQVLTHRMRNGAYQHFSYDGRGLLLAKTNPTWNADHDASLANDPKTTYIYYNPDQDQTDPIQWMDRVKRETDPRGLVTKYEYDHTFDSSGNETTTPAGSRGLVTKIIHVSDNNTYQAFGFNKYGDKLWEENELRQRTSYDHDDYGRVIKVTNALGKFVTNDYRPSNNPNLSPYVHTTGSVYETITATNIKTRNIYDENFRKTSTTVGADTADAATTWFQYDAVGNQTKVTDPRASTGSGDPTYTTITDYDQRNRPWRVTDPMGHITSSGYDAVGNILTVTRPDQSVETKTYNETNKVTSDKMPKDGSAGSPAGYVKTLFDYYPGNQQMAGELWHVSQLLTDSDTGPRRTTAFEYEPSGLKLNLFYPLNDSGDTNPIEYQAWTHDNDHNLIARRSVSGVSQLFGYDNRNFQISMTWSNALDWATFGHDSAGRMTSAQNPTSIVTRTYDDAGRLTHDQQQIQIMPIRAVSRKTHGSAGTFDVALPLTGTAGVECRVGQGTNSDQHQIIVIFPRAVSFNNAAITTGAGLISSTTQSADHTQVTINLTGVTNAQAIIVRLSGVNDGSVTNDVVIGMGVVLGDTNGSGAVSSSDIAQVQSQSGQSVTSSNFREDINLNGAINSSDIAAVQAQSGTGVSGLPNLSQPVPSSPAIDVQYGYDDDGKNTRLYATPGGITASYDLTFGYNDGQGRFKTISQTGGSQLFQYSYDLASNETHRTNNVNGLDQVYGRDSLNRMTERDVKNASGAISVEVYGYDPSRPGLMTSVTRQEQGQSAPTHDSFGYDLLPELSSAQYDLQGAATTTAGDLINQLVVGGSGGSGLVPVGVFIPPMPPNRTCSYGWDRAGNRTSLSDSLGQSYNYQTTSLNQYWTDGVNNMTNGNEHELAAYQNVNYSYINDSHVWLIAGTDVFGQQSRYEMYYDALGRRVVTVLNGSTTYYVYDGEKSILEYRGWSGGPSATDVYGKGIDEILKRTDYTRTTNQTVYYQGDHEGSITHLTDATGSILEYYRYDVFGKPTIYNSSGQAIQNSAFGNRILFTGREYVATFGIYEYRNRAYHPGLGRFMSEDPKGFDAGDYNLFRYCHNDPEDLTDPMGLDGTSVSVNPVETIQLRNPASDSIEATQLQKIQQAIRASQNGPDAAKTEVGGKLAGRNGPAQASHHDPETFPAKFYNKYGPLFNQTFKGVLAEDAKSVSDQTLNNAPALDVKQSVQQLARKAQKPGDRVVGLSDPKYGRFGKIYIAKGHFYRGSDEDVFGTYAHELANNVAARMIGNALKHGDAAPSGIYKEHWDNDVGAAVERRMFSGHEQGW